MTKALDRKNKVRRMRTIRVRKKLRGTTKKPRLSVLKTNANIHVQLIDDEKQETIAGISTTSKEMKGSEYEKKNKNSAKQLGIRIAEIAKEKGVECVVFDRGRFKYHGILAEVAEGARSTGLRI